MHVVISLRLNEAIWVVLLAIHCSGVGHAGGGSGNGKNNSSVSYLQVTSGLIFMSRKK